MHRSLGYAALMTTTRRVATAEVLSIGTELLVGETRDTNSSEIVLALAERGVTVRRIQALPDDLNAVAAAFKEAMTHADLVVSTGGLGPTPDDLTREAIAAAIGEIPFIDRGLEAWLLGLWERRGLPFPAINRKQAWLIPSATAIPNDQGTAPGWWVDGAGGSIVIALPGPPREMRPMWWGWVLPRLAAAGLGEARHVRTLRLSDIGESQVADRLGEGILRATNPVVATYARADAVDIRISAVSEPDGSGGVSRDAASLADDAEALIVSAVGDHVWARGHTTWAEALEAELDRRGWSLALAEIGTGGAVTALLGGAPSLLHAELRGTTGPRTAGAIPASRRGAADAARDLATATSADVGLAVVARERGGDMIVTVAVVSPDGSHVERRVAFLGGQQGRSRAALVAADVLLGVLRGRTRPR